MEHSGKRQRTKLLHCWYQSVFHPDFQSLMSKFLNNSRSHAHTVMAVVDALALHQLLQNKNLGAEIQAASNPEIEPHY